ncbi:uncharacterized protein Dyak_GE20941, isoform F [Drosophila yakuba]|uniref:Uncharacterized protein, isoform F n=1 Tax=Drosophila yakuba TaxID=7245 RepID=A0A0R1DXY6_DROYA|nr:uncharacterized protein Dyak_GE20941, isoform F [Drosophila yakuba]
MLNGINLYCNIYAQAQHHTSIWFHTSIRTEPYMSDDNAAPQPPALQQQVAPASATAPDSAPPPPPPQLLQQQEQQLQPHHHTQNLKSEPPTLEKPLAEKLTDQPQSPSDEVATGQ